MGNLVVRGPNGITKIGIQKSPPGGMGALPSGNGQAVIEILSGMGHGPTSGLGGADWVVGCGVFRGEVYRMGPSFNQEANDQAACEAAGISRLCSPSSPKGAWQFPWSVALTASGGATPSLDFSLSLPVAGRLYALEICVERVPLVSEDPCPCEAGCGGCCGGRCDLVDVTNWRSRQITTTYPGLGRDTGTRTAGGVFAAYNPNAERQSACLYGPSRLLNGQNFLPPWVPNVDLLNGNDELQWTISNNSAAYAVVVRQVLHIQYGSFDLTAAINNFCETKQSCGC